MAATNAPERRDWLAAAREATCRSQERLAQALGVSTKTVSYWERGLTTPTVDIRAALAAELGFTVAELNRRLGIASAPDPAEVNGHVTPFARLTSWLTTYERIEQSAYAIWTLDTHAFPALTQIEPYARAVELSSHRGTTPDEVDYLVGMRLKRATALGTAEYVALIATPLFTAKVGSFRAMAEQTAHMVELADRTNITLLLIDTEHLPAAPGPFTLFATAGPDADTVAEFNFDEPHTSHRLEVVSDRVAAFSHLRALARSPEKSREAIAKAADRYTALAKGTPT